MRATLPCVLAAIATLLVGGPAASVPPDTALVPSVVETVPTGTTGDTADDPAIWVNTTDPSASLVITNEKVVNRLTVFDLAGHVVQRLAGPSGVYGNVDVRGAFVAASISGVRVWRVNQTANGPRLAVARETPGMPPRAERACACGIPALADSRAGCT